MFFNGTAVCSSELKFVFSSFPGSNYLFTFVHVQLLVGARIWDAKRLETVNYVVKPDS